MTSSENKEDLALDDTYTVPSQSSQDLETPRLYTAIDLDYPVCPQPRHGFGKPSHPELARIIASGRDQYRQTLLSFTSYYANVRRIPAKQPAAEHDPTWINGWLPGLDVLSLYALVSQRNPRRYVEVGSGISTRVVRRAIRDHGLQTKLISIDPTPRASIDALCDAAIRQPVESIPHDLFNSLEAGDVLFIDSSHRCLTNSDVTVLMLEVLPRLRAGVLVEVHDVYLPDDYPPYWNDRFYSEQYLLAAFLLGGQRFFDIVLPCWYVSQDEQLSRIHSLLWSTPGLQDVEQHGGSFWLEIR